MKENLGLAHLVSLYVGQLGYGLSLAAIGLACSSLTQSQIVAAVLAYAIPFVIYDFAWIEPLITEPIALVLSEIELRSHFDRFARGFIELRHAVYFGGTVLVGYVVSLTSLELGRAR